MNTFTDTIDKIKKFDFTKFQYSEAVSGPDGKSSAVRFIAFWYGIALIFGAVVCFVLFILKTTNAIVTPQSLNDTYLFIGTGMAMVFGALGVNKSQEIKKEALNCEPKPDGQ